MSRLTTIARGGDSRIADPRRAIVRTVEEWRTLWAVHAGPDAEVPDVDLVNATIAAAFAGEKMSAGYGIEIARADPIPGGVRLVVVEQRPGPGMVTAQIITSPFHIVSVPKTAGDVAWAEGTNGNAASDLRPPTSNLRPPASDLRPPTSDPRPPTSDLQPPTSNLRPPASDLPSSTGLDPRTASALAYLAGPFSGALILFAESTSDLVRFHAWQSIVALGGLGLAVLASYVIAVAVFFVSATAASLMVAVATVIWIVLAIVWAICLWKALSGERWKLPLAGDFAERFV
jgi:uncharacterized membrane protein